MPGSSAGASPSEPSRRELCSPAFRACLGDHCLGASVLACAWSLLSAVGCFFTIIGIPFGIRHLKLAGLALSPIGKTVVSKEVAAATRKLNAEASVASLRSSARATQCLDSHSAGRAWLECLDVELERQHWLTALWCCN